MSTEENQMSRREALALMGASGVGLAVMGPGLVAGDTIDSKLRTTLPKFTEAMKQQQIA